MKPRIKIDAVAPEAYRAMAALGRYVQQSGIEQSLQELIKVRASQINGCAYCLDMHSKDARARGETEQRLYALSAWRETPFYTQRERAALAWAEAVTLVSRDQVPDETYAEVRRHFTEKEVVDLTMVIIVINAWNRLAISFRTVPGTYQPDESKQLAGAA